MSPWPILRSVVVLGLCSAIVAALARPPLAPDARLLVLAVIASVAAWSARSSLLLLAARKQRLHVDASAPTHRLSVAAGAAALPALATGVLVWWSPLNDRAAIVLVGTLGALIGALLSRGDQRPKGPRKTLRISWLLLDTALPAGMIAALVSTAIGVARLHALATVSPAEIARHLAATTFAYAVLLGLAGYAKGFGEKKSGLVIVHAMRGRSPGPIVVGGIAGVLLIFVGPHVLPALSFGNVLVLKATVGMLGGGALSLLGALQGARAAGSMPFVLPPKSAWLS